MIQEIFDLQQNNQNTMILPSVRSNPELIDERKNYKMNVLVEKSITLNKPKNQEDCNNYQKNGNNKLFLYLYIDIYIYRYIFILKNNNNILNWVMIDILYMIYSQLLNAMCNILLGFK